MSEQERMSEDSPLEPGDAGREMEQLLRVLTPMQPAFDAASVFAQAIRRSDTAARTARRQAWLWRGVAVGMAASLALVVWIRRPPPPIEHFVNVQVPATRETPVITPVIDAPAPPASCAYLILRQQVLAQGIDALHDAPAQRENESSDEVSPLRRLRAYRGGM